MKPLPECAFPGDDRNADANGPSPARSRWVESLAPLPSTTAEVLRLTDGFSTTATDLARLFSRDPALCSRLLRVASSPLFAVPGEVRSLERALAVLGFNGVRNVAIAAGLNRRFAANDAKARSVMEALWAHCVAVGLVTRALADVTSAVAADDAFLAGLLHDLGRSAA